MLITLLFDQSLGGLNGSRGSFIFPVNPEEVSIRRGGIFADTEVVNLGEVSMYAGEKLAEVSFGSFFPRDWDDYCTTNTVPAPLDAVSLIEKVRRSNRPVRLIISDTSFNEEVTIRDFEEVSKGGEPGDVYYTISFKAHRRVEIRKLDPSNPQAGSSARPASMAQVTRTTYMIQEGDTLYGIAKQNLGDGSRWRDIYNLNQAVIGDNPNLIIPGTELRLI